MKYSRYRMSFTTGGLFLNESVKVAELYRDLADWDLVRVKVLDDNLLQTRVQSTAKRVCCEIISRLKQFSSQELDLFVQANYQEQAYLLWLAICRCYTFIGDFAVEVLRERYLTLKSDLHYEDFDFFFNGKAEYHPELDEIKTTTRKKLRQVLFKILREAGLLTANNEIIGAVITQQLLQYNSYPSQTMSFFPVFESDPMMSRTVSHVKRNLYPDGVKGVAS